ncbi:MAG: methyltransferase domain-containing protein [Halioglobus sp.]|nr:methyltransferase domain-containing protein [Halioglobus sp.]
MIRVKKLLSRIDVASQSGIEIGPLNRPIVIPDMGDIAYVDHASTEQLREKYRNDPNVDIERIMDVRYIWGDKSLEQAVGPNKKFDYVLASHVIEHVPDVVTWLKEISTILKPGGILSLAIPDKRYTFDQIRTCTSSADLIDAYIRRLRKPSCKHIFDHFSLVAEVDCQKAWASEYQHQAPKKMLTEEIAFQMCQDAVCHDKYVDSHCWVFTPYSYFENLKTLIRLGLLDFEVVDYFDTEYGEIEFFVMLRKIDSALQGEDNRHRKLDSIPTISTPPALELQLEELQTVVEQQTHLVAAMRQSRSWRITAPLRGVTTWGRSRLRHPWLRRAKRLVEYLIRY